MSKVETSTNKIEELALAQGFDCLGTCSAKELVAREEVRAMCAANTCQMYEHSWACPPACGDIEEFQQLFDERELCIVTQCVAQLADSFDFEAMVLAEARQKKSTEELAKKIGDAGIDALVLTAGTCTLCKECTYPDAPCRMPEKRLVSMEAAGLVVSEVCGAANVAYNHGTNTLAYTGCVLI